MQFSEDLWEWTLAGKYCGCDPPGGAIQPIILLMALHYQSLLLLALELFAALPSASLDIAFVE